MIAKTTEFHFRGSPFHLFLPTQNSFLGFFARDFHWIPYHRNHLFSMENEETPALAIMENIILSESSRIGLEN